MRAQTVAGGGSGDAGRPDERRDAGDTVRTVAALTPEQQRRRERVETVIRLLAPGLNLVLAAGDRLSRIVERDDHEYYPPRSRTGTEPPPSAPAHGAGPRA